MSELRYIVSMPFKRKGKDILKQSEFILALSIDLNWFNPEQAKNILRDAEKAGLIERDGEHIHPAFDISSVQIPSGFKPDEKKTIFDRIIERIMHSTGMNKHKVIALINKKHEKLCKLVEIEVSAILVAMEYKVEVNDLIDEEYAALVKP